jgi:hypothetical protein
MLNPAAVPDVTDDERLARFVMVQGVIRADGTLRHNEFLPPLSGKLSVMRHLQASDDEIWAEGREVRRLSTRVPGLGSPEGTIDLDSSWMQEAAARDPEVADFVRRARDFWPTWLEALSQAGPDYFARGCGWR